MIVNVVQEADLRIYLAGDSTVSEYDASMYPQTGWGMVIGDFFTDAVKVQNRAICGYSSKSFYDEGKLADILSKIRQGDYLFIQFGHNDEKDDEKRHTDPWTIYQTYLKYYINGAQDRGAIPVLVTPVERRNFIDRVFVPTHGEYPAAMRLLAINEGIALIDLTQKSTDLLITLGEENSKKLYMWFSAGEYSNTQTSTLTLSIRKDEDGYADYEDWEDDYTLISIGDFEGLKKLREAMAKDNPKDINTLWRLGEATHLYWIKLIIP